MSDYRWPQLQEPHDSALREAVEYVEGRFAPMAVVVAGSILRGNGGPTSDLDLYVIHNAPFRQRIQRRFRGVPVEVFVNPPSRVRQYFADEAATGRPITAHMLATGHLVLGDPLNPVVAALRREAENVLMEGPFRAAESMTLRRYLAADLFDDATDVLETDPDAASIILIQAVEASIRCLFWERGLWQPKSKHLLSELETIDVPLARLARVFTQVAVLGASHELAREIVRRCTGSDGFFEWESTPDYVA